MMVMATTATYGVHRNEARDIIHFAVNANPTACFSVVARDIRGREQLARHLRVTGSERGANLARSSRDSVLRQ